MGTNSHTTQKAIISYFDKVFGEYMQSKTLSALLQKNVACNTATENPPKFKINIKDYFL
ncbi:hypothetical protein Pf1_02554 [Flavobacterium columnare]|nr:hypothetical protein Pf1_02554 [Flavobacterium columnare]